MEIFVITVRDGDLKASHDRCGLKVVWCLLLMEASPCLLAQVLHLQNKQVIVVSTTVVLLPPPALSAMSAFIDARLDGGAVFKKNVFI